MSRVLVLGVGPLPIDPTPRLHAPGIRVWHLATLLQRHKHSVVLGAIEFGDFTDNKDAPFRPLQEPVGDRLTVCRFRYHSERTPLALASLHEQCRFDCVVSTTDIMNDVAARSPLARPLWFDYLGDPLSERQLQAATYDNDTSLLDLWRVMLSALLSGDRFSVASTPQKYVLIGQLASVGRLNQFTAGQDLVYVLPNSSRVMAERPSHDRRVVKGSLIPVDSFMVLWAGGYNTWTDPATLFQGLELAMRQDPSIYFVSVGGEIPGHDNVTFNRFRALCEASELRSHFQFLGWVSPDDMPNYYGQADAAINVDLPCYEAEIGTRTRLVDWVLYDVPIVTTACCEPARILEEHGLIESFQPGCPSGLAAAILRIKADHLGAKERARRAHKLFDELYREEETFAPLLQWVEDPCFALDRQRRVTPVTTDRHSGVEPPDSLLCRLQLSFLATHGRGSPHHERSAPRIAWWKRLWRR